MINEENYEGYLMRFADGELSTEEAAEVELFLDAHPDLLEELDGITSATLRVTPPLATLPGKERLLHEATGIETPRHKKVWMAVAATITLFVVASGVARFFLIHVNNKAVSQHAKTTHETVGDTLLPDSIYIHPEKREPVYLAQTEPSSLIPLPTHQYDFTTQDSEFNIDNSKISIEDSKTEDSKFIIHNSEFDIAEVPSHNFKTPNSELKTEPMGRARLVGGRVIVIETDKLVEIVPERSPSIRPDVSRGYIVENSFLAVEEEKGVIGKTIDRIAAALRRQTSDLDTLLANNE